jgi:hypothetical protein
MSGTIFLGPLFVPAASCCPMLLDQLADPIGGDARATTRSRRPVGTALAAAASGYYQRRAVRPNVSRDHVPAARRCCHCRI